MSINKWEHLFSKGEYPSREKLLSGLTLDHVNANIPGISHSIYEELWHLATWQDVVISNDQNKIDSFEKGKHFPENKAQSIDEWNELVNKFNADVEKILEYSKSKENLAQEIEPGFTISDTLSCLAVHNAVHFGKILAIRQSLNAWPPK